MLNRLEHKTMNDLILTRGERVYTTRYTNVDDTNGQALSFPVLIREFRLHYEGSTVVARRLGEIPGSTVAHFTSDGKDDPPYPIVAEAGKTIMTLYGPAGGTVNISVIAWG